MSQTSITNISVAEPWFTLIRDGKKTVEGKKNSTTWNHIRVGDVVRFVRTGEESKLFYAEVTKINFYKKGLKALDRYLLGEGLEACLPGVKTLEEGKAVYCSWSTEDEIDKVGMLAIHIKVM